MSYHDFSAQLAADPSGSKAHDSQRLQRIMTTHVAAVQHSAHLHQDWSADMARGKSRVVKEVLAEMAAAGGGGEGRDDATVASQNTAFEDWINDVRARK